MTFAEQVHEYLAAAYPMLYVETHEEQRAIEELRTLAMHPGVSWKFWTWTSTLGFIPVAQGDAPQGIKELDPRKSLEKVLEFTRDTVVILKDFHPYLSNNQLKRQLRDMISHLESTGKCIIFLSPVVEIPVELEKDITPVRFTLPDAEKLGGIIDRVIKDAEAENEMSVKVSAKSQIVEASRGLTANEARNIFSLVLARYNNFEGDESVRAVLNEKAHALRKSQLVSWVDVDTNLDDIGGLENVKRYLRQIAPIFWKPDEAKTFGLRVEDFPRSIMLVGPPGTGKSYTAKAIARFLKIGCTKTDFGSIFSAGGGRVGAAEGNIERRNALIEAMAPLVDWWDEAEKGLAGVQGSRENPWEARVGGTLLTWFEEHRSPVLVVATVNRQEQLPPEMLSRFQRVFFVDLPNEQEREEIFRIQLAQRGVTLSNTTLRLFAELTPDFNGREIRNAVQSAMQMAFAERTPLEQNIDLLGRAIRGVNPVARTRKQEIERIRQWARENNIESASAEAQQSGESGGRRVRTKR